ARYRSGRSAHRTARRARTGSAASRRARSPTSAAPRASASPPSGLPRDDAAAAALDREQGPEPGSREVGERARERDHKSLNDHDGLPRDRRDFESELGAALIERAEQQARQNHTERVVAPHQRDGNAAEAVAGGEIQDQAMMHAGDLVDADKSCKRARE